MKRVLILAILAAAATAQDKKPRTINDVIVRGCELNVGKTVGDGECSSLASQALKEAGARPRAKDAPGPGDYVWGRQVYLVEADGKRAGKLADVKPGDVMQFRDATFKGGRASAHHTAIVRGTDGDTVQVWHQNTRGKRYVVEDEYQLAELTAGWVRIYRPLPR